MFRCSDSFARPKSVRLPHTWNSRDVRQLERGSHGAPCPGAFAQPPHRVVTGSLCWFPWRGRRRSRPLLRMKCMCSLCHRRVTSARKHVGNVLPGVSAGSCCNSEAGRVPQLLLGCVRVSQRRAVRARLQLWAGERHLPAARGKIKPSRSGSQGCSGHRERTRRGGVKSDIFPRVPGVRGAARVAGTPLGLSSRPCCQQAEPSLGS